MAKGGKLTKLKSALKKWNSFSKPSRTNRSSVAAASEEDDAGNLFPVFVGKSLRRYLVSPDVIDHPLFQELVDRSTDSDRVTVACEVVMFEHLLWMLENSDPKMESLDELVGFYAY